MPGLPGSSFPGRDRLSLAAIGERADLEASLNSLRSQIRLLEGGGTVALSLTITDQQATPVSIAGVNTILLGAHQKLVGVGSAGGGVVRIDDNLPDYLYLNIDLTSQNEFYGDQTFNVVKLAPSGYDDFRFLLRNTNGASTGAAMKLQYYNAGWVDSGTSVSCSTTPATMEDSGWVAIPAGWAALGDAFVRAYHTPNDASTDIPSAQLLLRKKLKVT
jgi:hypothetical protein